MGLIQCSYPLDGERISTRHYGHQGPPSRKIVGQELILSMLNTMFAKAISGL